jgi:hypothetical protein
MSLACRAACTVIGVEVECEFRPYPRARGQSDDCCRQPGPGRRGARDAVPGLVGQRRARLRRLRQGRRHREDHMTENHDHQPDSAARCPVPYCRAEAGHRDLHDIRACLKTCGPIRPGIGREHDAACPNAKWSRNG